MTEPQLDPITGLPADISTSSIFSILLNSRPALAPQWNPQGSEPPGIYPDRIPSVFATMQAQNQDNPATVNALRTHTGTQALEVYQVNASGGGGISPITPIVNYSTHHFNGSGGADINFSSTGLSVFYGLWFSGTFVSDTFAPSDPQTYRLYFRRTAALGSVWPIAAFTINLNSATPADAQIVSGSVVPVFPLTLSAIDGAGPYSLYVDNNGGPVGDLSISHWGT